MSSTPDDMTGARRLRAGLLEKWPDADFGAMATDEALLRLTEARNVASKSANRFMLIGAALSLLYLLKLQGLASDIDLGPYNLASLPFGLFILSSAALIVSCVSLIRIGDSRSYDRQLMLGCEQRFGCDCHLRYLAFPNEYAWGEPFSRMAGLIQAGAVMFVWRGLTTLLISLYLLSLAAAPMAAGVDFILSHRSIIQPQFSKLQIGVVTFLLATNVAVFFLVSWMRLVDRD